MGSTCLQIGGPSGLAQVLASCGLILLGHAVVVVLQVYVPAASAPSRNLLAMHILGPARDLLTQKVWGTASCILTSLWEDSGACSSLRTIALLNY